MLIDNHNRVINYVRLAVTDRCNLRCNYCMPERGIKFAQRNDLLTTKELQRLSDVLIDLGVDKIRLTGGEPFVRSDIRELLEHLGAHDALKELSVTTNATLIGPYLKQLKAMGLTSVNISLDAIRPETFARITRRDSFAIVRENLMKLLEEDLTVRINFVVLEGQNIDDIYPMMEFQEKYPVQVRFLEEMPFNGGSRNFKKLHWNHKQILEHIRLRYPEFEKQPAPLTSTSVNYKIEGHAGGFGVIPSFSRTFCGSCNRLRVTATGDLVTCLYGKPVANVRELIRRESDTDQLAGLIRQAVGSRAKDGFEAQERFGPVFGSSMTSIGG
ncbi:cyclic pyranopterin monophosphate synthase subunit MoaA [Robiginitalea myxolifaciens]|uniref:GTP 3',8-cyclase n=1 Tax=Robiginitalea myxolifaciens TaxID=400055 RepID=A0A1I6GYA6_9FLAO|nr:GTP 3',8-cyclase MoaA [Robiginitalea myxolifaciens]SFR47007.1 cyclic pyranopterin monophosphate synthase subunit MoaA [Robiginitalea myxolifaciens]